MKIKTFCLFFLSIITIIFNTQVHARTAVINVSGGPTWKPIYFKDAADKPTGVAVDLMKAFGKKKNIKIKFHQMPRSRAFIEVEKGNIDMMVGVYWTNERAKKFVYSIPFAFDEIKVFVLKGKEFPLNSLKDLQGRIGGRPSFGSTFGEDFDDYASKHLTIEHTTKHQQLVDKLLRGYNDYILLAHWDGLSTIKKQGVSENIVVLPYSVAANPIYIMASKRSGYADLIPEINNVIKQMKKDGTLRDIVKKYAAMEDFPGIDSLVDDYIMGKQLEK
jgi:polar amino acid transport system substrate-binding protein